ncbi:chromatin accessibility complex protein 1 [Morphnus guianensis]
MGMDAKWHRGTCSSPAEEAGSALLHGGCSPAGRARGSPPGGRRLQLPARRAGRPFLTGLGVKGWSRSRGGKMAARLSGGENRLVSLPLSRIRVIMKSSPEVSSINQDALFLTAKATELFVQYLATYSYKHGRGKEKNALTYSDLSHTAEECETFQFLADILPKKILASKYLKMLEKEKRDGEVGEDDEEDEEEEDEVKAVDEDVGS